MLTSSVLSWNRQISLVKHELLDLTTVKLPKFVRKARWKLPSEIESDAAASQSIPEDEQGQAATHNAHAHISDILTLELANIRGQSDRLQHAILPTSARLIDQLIDASAKPLPDRFLDAQDEAESCVKQELNCVVEFAADLAKQRSATEAIWASLESAESDLQQLCKDAQAASLTLPSSSVAARLDERMSRLQSATEEARDRTAALPRPCCGDDLFSQNEHNTLLLQALQDRLAILQAGALHSASEQVLNYRSAVTTIIAADDFCSAAAAALHALRSAIKRSHAIDYAACLTAGVAEEPIETILSLRYDLSSALATAIELQDAASNISDQLRQRGMDPNMRKKVHDLTLSLVTSCRDAKKLLSDDERRISALRNLVAWKESVNATLQSSAVAVQSHKEYLAHYDVLQEVHATSVEPQSEPKTMVEAMKAGLDTGQGLITSITENFHPDDVARLVNLHGIVQKRLRDTLKIATAQREMRAAVALQVSTARSFLHSAEKLQATIVERISDHQLVSHEQYTSLMQQMVAFEQKAHTEVIFCAKPALESAPLPRLAENDTRLRYELNSRILSLEDGLRTLGALRDTAQAKLQLATRLHGLDAEVTTLHPEIEAMSRCDGEDAARLTTRLASLSAQLPDTDAFSDSPDLLALQADLQSRLASIGDRLQLLSQEDLVASGVMLPVSAISDDNQDRSVNDSFTAPTLLLSDNSVGVDMTPATGQLGACDDKETCAPACRTTGTTENSTELEVTRNKPLTSRQSDDGLPLRSPVARADAAAVIEKTPLIPSQTSPASNGHISDFLAAASDLDRLISETLDKSNSDAGLSASPDHRLQRHWSRVQLAAEPVSATPGVSKRLDRLGQTMSQLLARQTEGESPAAASVSNPSRTPLPVTSSLAQALPEFPSTPRSSKYGHLSRIPGGPPTSRPSTAHGSSSKRMATYHQKSASSRTRTISSITTPNLLFSPRSTSSPALNETPIKQRPRYSSIRRSSSSNLSLRKSLRPNAYIANPSQTLDQAVASIVNDLQVRENILCGPSLIDTVRL